MLYYRYISFLKLTYPLCVSMGSVEWWQLHKTCVLTSYSLYHLCAENPLKYMTDCCTSSSNLPYLGIHHSIYSQLLTSTLFHVQIRSHGGFLYMVYMWTVPHTLKFEYLSLLLKAFLWEVVKTIRSVAWLAEGSWCGRPLSSHFHFWF